MSPRSITHRYEDPLDLIWLRCARELGFEIARSHEVYASFDGQRVITLSTEDDFDPDDSLAQMILHELCHALVAGFAAPISGEPDAAPTAAREDWGLDNTSDRDLLQEHATHRLQAHLADRWGLRPLFAVTTQWREHFDRLGKDPLAGPDPAAALARDARAHADREPWAGALRRALSRTAEIADLVRRAASPGSLWAEVSPRVHERHPLGVRLGPVGERCETCAWAHAAAAEHGPQRALSCEMLRTGTGAAPRVRPEMLACQHFEPRLDEHACAQCGACCHRAFHVVPVAPDEPIATSRPDLLSRDDGPGARGVRLSIDRPGGFCRALERPAAPYRCSVYTERPQSCRDFALGGKNCLEARRRVGLSARP